MEHFALPVTSASAPGTGSPGLRSHAVDQRGRFFDEAHEAASNPGVGDAHERVNKNLALTRTEQLE